jgi:hypothetical protein
LAPRLSLFRLLQANAVASYQVIPRGRTSSEPFAAYVYEVRKNGRRVAKIRHNARGEDFEFRMSSLGEWESCDPMIEGGGPEPLRLTTEGERLISERSARPI